MSEIGQIYTVFMRYLFSYICLFKIIIMYVRRVVEWVRVTGEGTHVNFYERERRNVFLLEFVYTHVVGVQIFENF